MQNIDLKQGICPNRKEKISREWAGRKPVPGTLCETCAYKQVQVFRSEHIEFLVTKGGGDNEFNGSRLIINGKRVTIISVCGGSL